MYLVTDAGLCHIMRPIIKRSKEPLEVNFMKKGIRNGLYMKPNQLWTANHHMILDILFDYRYKTKKTSITIKEMKKLYPFLNLRPYQVIKCLNDISSLKFNMYRYPGICTKLLSFTYDDKVIDFDLIELKGRSYIPSELYSMKDYTQFIYRNFCSYTFKCKFINKKSLLNYLKLKNERCLKIYIDELSKLKTPKLNIKMDAK